MSVVLTVLALDALLEQAFEQFLAQAAYGGARVRVQGEGVGNPRATTGRFGHGVVHSGRGRQRRRGSRLAGTSWDVKRRGATPLPVGGRHE